MHADERRFLAETANCATNVILSAAKDLGARTRRSFGVLQDDTLEDLIISCHLRASAFICGFKCILRVSAVTMTLMHLRLHLPQPMPIVMEMHIRMLRQQRHRH